MKKPKHHINAGLWVDKYADYLYNYAIARVNDTFAAEELVQETFLAGLKAKKDFKGEASERTWLVAILKRKIIDLYRKNNSEKGQAEIKINLSNRENQETNWLQEMVMDTNYRSAEEELENKELGLAIENCLNQLPVKHADIFKQKTILGRDTEAICKEFNITPSNLWVIIHRARTQLMDCLNEKWFAK